MLRLITTLTLLAGASPDAPVVPRHALTFRNIGASEVTLRLLRPDGSSAWGPYAVGAHESLKLETCPCAQLTLEMRAPRRSAPVRWAPDGLRLLVVSEDRWSDGSQRAEPEDGGAACPAHATCDGPAFEVHALK